MQLQLIYGLSDMEKKRTYKECIHHLMYALIMQSSEHYEPLIDAVGDLRMFLSKQIDAFIMLCNKLDTKSYDVYAMSCVPDLEEHLKISDDIQNIAVNIDSRNMSAISSKLKEGKTLERLIPEQLPVYALHVPEYISEHIYGLPRNRTREILFAAYKEEDDFTPTCVLDISIQSVYGDLYTFVNVHV